MTRSYRKKTFIRTKEFLKSWDSLCFTDEYLHNSSKSERNEMKKVSIYLGEELKKELINMSKRYNSDIQGLPEAIDDTKGTSPLKKQTVAVEPLKKYTPQKIKEIRSSIGMSQKSFAGYLGISQKTVEAWEAGINKPNGTAARLLHMIELKPEITTQFQFVKLL